MKVTYTAPNGETETILCLEEEVGNTAAAIVSAFGVWRGLTTDQHKAMLDSAKIEFESCDKSYVQEARDDA